MTGNAQSYVDDEIAHHQAALEHAPIVEGILTHGVAIAQLRWIRRQQYRPHDPVAETWATAIDAIAEAAAHPERLEWHRDEDRDRTHHYDDGHDHGEPPWSDETAPPTSPIYALTAQSLGIDPAGGR